MTLNTFLLAIGPWQLLLILFFLAIPVAIAVTLIIIFSKKRKRNNNRLLEKLFELRQKGIITEEEYNKQKAEIINV